MKHYCFHCECETEFEFYEKLSKRVERYLCSICHIGNWDVNV
jgi:hypothetical protein